jgi:site-specific DNA-methyltransferase (adenine-specific)
VCTDPPYHLTTGKKGGSGPASLNLDSPAGRSRITTGFMGKAWDGGDIAFDPATWRPCFDILKPGGYLVAFGGTRTHHRIWCAIEDAGFEVRDTIAWLYASGFPKSRALLKPAFEPIILARKPGPLRNLDIDGCRIGAYRNTTPSGMDRYNARNAELGYRPGAYQKGAPPPPETEGRWPPNVAHDGSDEVMAAFAAFGPTRPGHIPRSGQSKALFGNAPQPITDHANNAFGDAGTAARFFFSGKAGEDDRCDSKHPTVKPVALLRWLVRLVTPEGGTVLDPFAGSGTTAVACVRERRDCILIEREAEYVGDIARRLRRLQGLDTPLFEEAAE